MLLCVQSGKTMADPNRFKFDARDFYLKSPQEMRAVWRELPEACDNTLLIAQRCEVELRRERGPDAAVRRAGGPHRGQLAATPRSRRASTTGSRPACRRSTGERADFELGVIAQMGFPGYFLVVADLCRHARESAIRLGPGRGSAAGSLVAWALRITELDPIEHGLLFERFLNPERVSMPDIDLDFDERRRGDMIRYATEKYGEDRVSQIITYSTIKAKAAVKDAARVLGFPYGIGDKITKAMPRAGHGQGHAARRHLRPAATSGTARPRSSARSTSREPDVKKVVDTARGLEGLRRQWGVHAAGVILSRDPLLDVIPIQRREQDGAIITQFDMGACESLGLLKMDFLGLRNLTVLDDALRHIEDNRGEDVDLETLPLDRPEAYELLCRGDTIGVFQFEGGPMRSLIRSMQPSTFEDVAALIALYRPGPMGMGSHLAYVERKHGRAPMDPIHPEFAESLAEILAETYGVIVYQEQVMAIAQKVAGLLARPGRPAPPGDGQEEEGDPRQGEGPVPRRDEGATATATPAIAKLWETLIPFADYAFNKSHCRRLRPGVVLDGVPQGPLPRRVHGRAADLGAGRQGQERAVPARVPPDGRQGAAAGRELLQRGLLAGRHRHPVRPGRRSATSARTSSPRSARPARARARTPSFADFLAKVEPVVCNKKVIESLIKAGAFDSLGHTRQGLLRVHAEAVDACMDTKRAEAVGQFDLFGSGGAATTATPSRGSGST